MYPPKKGTLKVVQGDVTNPQKSEDEVIIIPHLCNNLGIMGGGVALGLKRKWPIITTLYKEYGDLGECSFPDVGNNIIVANMVAQDGLVNANNSKPIKYWALVKCMMRVKNWASSNNITTIIAPKFGSLRAGGNWNFILELIEEIWLDYGIDVTIYEWDG